RTLTQGNSADESLYFATASLTVSLLYSLIPLTARRAIIAFEALATVAKASNSNGLIYARALFSLCSPAVGRIGAGCTIDWMSNNGGASSLPMPTASARNDSRQPLLDSRTEGDFAVALPLLRCVLLLHSDGRDCQPKRCDLALTASERYCRLVGEPQRLPLNSFLPMLAGTCLRQGQLCCCCASGWSSLAGEGFADRLPLVKQEFSQRSASNLLVCTYEPGVLSHIPNADVSARRLRSFCITGSEDPLAAQTALECLAGAQPLPLVKQDQQLRVDLLCHVHLARRHPDADVSARAVEVWRRQFVADSPTPTANCRRSNFIRCLASPRAAIRQAAAVALAALAVKPDLRRRMTRDRPPDRWEGRSAVAAALEQLLPKLTVLETKDLCSSLVESLLRDESDKVRSAMLKMGQKAVELHGRDCLTELVALFERFLETAPATAALDSVRQGVVVLLGQLARYLDAERDQARICKIFARLLDTLSIPSQSVQEAVSACLPPLMPAMRKDKEVIVEKLLLQALEADSYAQRKGAAYGLAGATKGLGIAVLKEIQVNQRLLDAMKDKKNPQRREGALLALEQICIVWGRLFEPYVVSILPSLLICCGDTVACVRQAADECSIAVMSKLSNHGVKLVLPSLLSTLAEDNWRTKCASVDLLGSMSYCAPKQLSACLPQIVPKLMEVLTDSHVRVQKAGEEALAKIGKVITNQEIRDIVPHLLDAIRDPDGHTNAALQRLLSVKFVHKIDTASLALIMPVLGRAFRDPATDTRKTAALIVGSMYRLTDRADLTPYMESLMPGLKKCLLDPVPDVRSVAAKALGSMVREMGETSFQDLFPWLMRTLVSEDSPINRAGAAQGLSEMIGGMGSAKLESLMPELINTAKQPDIAPHVRDGYLLMFVFLPRVFQTDFSQYVSATLPAILSGLANEIEFVRETALKAGQTLVQQYSKMAISLLLPELEVGLFDENWRIRYSSVQLLGDLLYKLSGASGKGTTVSANDDDTMGSSNEFARIGDQLGQERRNRVLAGLYVSRSDSALLVRQASCHVWKVVVPHTPRTLQAILPTLLPMLLGNLASASSDMREVSAKTLGDIVKKLGERVLQHMMQMLQTGLDSSDAKQREGVCLALSEIMRSVPKDHMQSYADQLVPTVRRALADPLPSVRVAASRTFDQLYTVLGQRALDDIVIKLQSDLEAGNVDDPDAALDGLKQAVAARSEVALPYLVPRLTQEPVNTRTLAILASVAGGALTPHLSRILPALLGALDPDSEDQMDQCRTVMHSVRDDAGVQLTIRHLTSSELSNQPLNYRLGAARLLHSLTQRDDSAEMLAEHTEAVLRACLRSYCIQDPRVIAAAHDCLAGLVSRCPTPSELVAPIRTAVRHVLSEPQHRATVTLVPGFCSLQPRGIQPLLNVYREGLLSGQVEQKEAAALGLKELIERTSPDALKSSVVAITGPLIRVLGDRFSAQLKCAVIDALTALLGRCGPGMKAFLPQLQLTLFKALADPAQTLRSRAALAIGQLASVHAKPDQMAAELLSALAKPDAYQTTLLSALRQWCLLAGRSLSPAACESVLNAVKSNKLCGAGADEETARACAGACVGLLAAACSAVTDTALGQFLLTAPPSGASDSAAWQEWQARLAGLAAYLGAAPADSVKERLGDIETAVLAAVGSDRSQVVDAGVRCIGLALAKAPQSERLVAGLVKAQKHENSDVKLLTSQAASFAIEALPDDQLLNCLAKPLLPMLANGTREKNIGVKAASEQALADACRLYRAERLTASCLDRLEPAMRDSVQQIVDRLAKKQWQRVPVCLDRTAAIKALTLASPLNNGVGPHGQPGGGSDGLHRRAVLPRSRVSSHVALGATRRISERGRRRPSHGGLVRHESLRRSEQVVARVVPQVGDTLGVDIGVALQLVGEAGQAAPGPEQRAQEAVGGVHLADNVANIGANALDLASRRSRPLTTRIDHARLQRAHIRVGVNKLVDLFNGETFQRVVVVNCVRRASNTLYTMPFRSTEAYGRALKNSMMEAMQQASASSTESCSRCWILRLSRARERLRRLAGRLPWGGMPALALAPTDQILNGVEWKAAALTLPLGPVPTNSQSIATT
uniref:TOG domain-containing protein n=1 Tax=Macrostomum lignano TaxID=282301 RepID=A0A1I8IK66_9PLAT